MYHIFQGEIHYLRLEMEEMVADADVPGQDIADKQPYWQRWTIHSEQEKSKP